MPLTDPQREALFAALSSHGWHWRDGAIYAPHETMWLSGEQPWHGDLRDFHERMTDHLRRNERARELYGRAIGLESHEHLLSDTRSLVEVLADLLSLPPLEAFFAPLADEIQRFAARHNLDLERQYRAGWPAWFLQFTHPAGGDAKIEIVREGENSFVLHQMWWIDDYGAATRSIRDGKSPEYQVGTASFSDVLRESLAEMLRWRKGEWTQVADGYEGSWHRYTREQFERMGCGWPLVRWPDDAT